MQRLRTTIFQALALTFVLASSAFAQNDAFADPNAGYTFGLPDAKWKMTVKPTATIPNVEYVYGDRIDGHLEVRRLNTQKDSLTPDIVRDEEQKLQFLPGFVAGKDENFAGKLRGIAFNYEFVRAGKPMSGRFYFLRANDTTVYVLRFTGLKDSLRTIRNQTDSVARTFAVK